MKAKNFPKHIRVINTLHFIIAAVSICFIFINLFIVDDWAWQFITFIPAAGFSLIALTALLTLFLWLIIELLKKNISFNKQTTFSLGMNFKAFLLIICIWSTGNHYYKRRTLQHKTVNIIESIHSPDKSKVVHKLCYDLGAPGYTAQMYALFDTSSTKETISKHLLPNETIDVEWIDNSTLNILYDSRSYEATKTKFKPPKSVLKSVKYRFDASGFKAENDTEKIVQKIQSPDTTLKIIVYRYTKNKNLHVSVIDKNDEVPEIGNTFISMGDNDLIYSVKWLDNDTIEMTTNDMNYSKLKRYISVHSNDIRIKYKILKNDDYIIKYKEPFYKTF